MVIAIITNFAIIFSSTIILYWLLSRAKNKRRLTVWENRALSVVTGISFGVISLIITILFLDIAHNLLVNTRFIPFLLSGLIGGPIAMLVNALFIFLIRFMLDFGSMASLIVSINALGIGTLLSIVAIFKPITLKSIHYYFSFIFVEIIILLLIINEWSLHFFIYLLNYICYSLALYIFLIYVINYLIQMNTHANKSAALMKTDFLTQLPNNVALENQLQQYIRQRKPFEMAHLDIDLFKNINMQYGYREGDQVISQLAQTIRVFAERRGAYVARIGGDEFCYVIENSSPANAIIEMHELCKHIENLSFTIQNEQIQITLSGSIISYPSNAETLREIYTASNYALKMITETKTNTVVHINQLKQQHPHY